MDCANLNEMEADSPKHVNRRAIPAYCVVSRRSTRSKWRTCSAASTWTRRWKWWWSTAQPRRWVRYALCEASATDEMSATVRLIVRRVRVCRRAAVQVRAVPGHLPSHLEGEGHGHAGRLRRGLQDVRPRGPGLYLDGRDVPSALCARCGSALAEPHSRLFSSQSIGTPALLSQFPFRILVHLWKWSAIRFILNRVDAR